MLLQVGKVLLNPSTATPVTFKRWLVATDAFKCADEAVSIGIYEVGAGGVACPCPVWQKTGRQLSTLRFQVCPLCMWVRVWLGSTHEHFFASSLDVLVLCSWLSC